MKLFILPAAVCICIAGFSLHCINDPTYKSVLLPEIGPESITQRSVYNYTLTANNTIRMMDIDSVRYTALCNGNNLDSGTYTASPIFLKYSMPDNNTFRLLFVANDSMLIFVEFDRTGSGSGIIGQWSNGTYGYEAMPGMVLSPATKADWDASSAAQNNKTLSLSLTINQMQMVMSGMVLSMYADYLIAEINSTWGGIFTEKQNSSTAKLTNRSTGEVVVVYQDAQSDIHFLSSDSTHSGHVYYSKPTTCPNNPYPEWWSAFLSGNPMVSILGKVRVFQSLNIPVLSPNFWMIH